MKTTGVPVLASLIILSIFFMKPAPAEAGSNFDFQTETAHQTHSLPGGSLSISRSPVANHTPKKSVRNLPAVFQQPVALLIDEGFEASLAPPAGWSEVISNHSRNWDISADYPHSGEYAAIVEFDDNQDEWLLSPQFNLSQATLSFWSYGSVYYCRTPNDFCDLKVWVVVGDIGGGDDIYLGKAEDDWLSSWSWEQSTFNLTSILTGGAVRIGFEYLGNDGADIMLDDVSLDGTQGISEIYLPIIIHTSASQANKPASLASAEATPVPP